jgi:pilus assembly protein CpaC
LASATVAAPDLHAQSMQELKMIVGRSVVVDYPADIGRISTSNPETVDYVAVTTREILLHAKSHGNATLIVWSKSGQREFYNITVEHNLEPIRRILKATFPNESIEVQSARDTVTLNGTVSAQPVIERALAVATPLAKSVVNNLKLATPKIEKQILLRVKFAELNRNVADNFGVNLLAASTGNTLGRIDPGGYPAPTVASIGGDRGSATNSRFTISDALNIFAFRPDLNIGAFVKALQGQGLLQILAEPNLVTENGQAASFLVGANSPFRFCRAARMPAPSPCSFASSASGSTLSRNSPRTTQSRCTSSLRSTPSISLMASRSRALQFPLWPLAVLKRTSNWVRVKASSSEDSSMTLV